ncbi:MAG: hypothetical protein H6677_12790 [Candidatus Obscuribacterales bacterium]|nr:hypothetical protein [Cyanobacteria bacterium HKST-UBA01]MCB9469143.1 hypothetical protein [Candidatus Obscuribacterales bacterium]
MKRIFSTAVFVTGACLLIGFGYHILTDSNVIFRNYIDLPESAVADWPESVVPNPGMQDLGDGNVRVRTNANGELFNPSLNSVVGSDRKTFFHVSKKNGKYAIDGLMGANINPVDPDLHLSTKDLGISELEEELFMKVIRGARAASDGESAGSRAGERSGARAGTNAGEMTGARIGAMAGGAFMKVKN